jgi:hypothetical protein
MPANATCLCPVAHSQSGSASGQHPPERTHSTLETQCVCHTHCRTRPPGNNHAQRPHAKGRVGGQNKARADVNHRATRR